MSLAVTIACFLVLIAGLFAVIVERTNERDAARDELDRADDTITRLEGENAYLSRQLLDAQAATWDARPHLRVVDDLPVADESWLDEITKPGGWS